MPYYFNAGTGETLWERPTADAPAAPPAAPPAPPAPPDPLAAAFAAAACATVCAASAGTATVGAAVAWRATTRGFFQRVLSRAPENGRVQPWVPRLAHFACK